LHLGRWNQQGHPFYSEGVSYREEFKIADKSGRYLVALCGWHGSVARVLVNGETAGFVGWAPWQLDVTDRIAAGTNRVEVVVIGTLKNTLGPHHGKPAPGSAWPGMFHQGPGTGPPPGSEYDTVGYGLYAPFFLKHQPAAQGGTTGVASARIELKP
jgi:hypothetical protein